jgi:hypothetical protein
MEGVRDTLREDLMVCEAKTEGAATEDAHNLTSLASEWLCLADQPLRTRLVTCMISDECPFLRLIFVWSCRNDQR